MPRKIKPLSMDSIGMKQLVSENLQLSEDKVTLTISLEQVEEKAKDLRKVNERLKTKTIKLTERVNTTIQAMTFIVTYCAREVRQDVPPGTIAGSFEQTAFERVMGTEEGAVMAWSVAKNWLEGHWANVNEEREVPGYRKNMENWK